MNPPIMERSVLITSPQGLHMRPATAFAQLAATFQSDVTVSHNGRSVNGKSGWEMMTMMALPGTLLSVKTAGADAPKRWKHWWRSFRSGPRSTRRRRGAAEVK